MGLVSNLCTELGVSQDVLARIVGLPAEQVAEWDVGGVPPRHHSDFRPLEDVLDLIRHRTRTPVRRAVRVELRELGDASVLELLLTEGPVAVLERLRALIPRGAVPVPSAE